MKKKRNSLLFALLVAVWLVPVSSYSQYAYDNHPELKWYSIETEHFYVHFHNGTERTAKLTAKIAEDIYAPVTELYRYQPNGKIHFIIRDHDDYSNGAAFYYDNKIEIWATSMDFDLRGSHNWLRNVITHEFVHMIQIGSARKITRRIPALYFQAIGYENDRREDVLHGGPNVIASYPLSMTVMPSWFAEGVAQYQLPGLDYDTWDSHRDMILRTATLDGKLLTYNEMGSFGKNSLGNEKSYNQGFAFVSYVAENHGVDALRKISREMKGIFRLTFDGALKKVTGKSARELYREWKRHLQAKYAQQIRRVVENKIEGEIIEPKGIGNFYPAWAPDDESLAYLSTFDSDYLSPVGFLAKGPLVKKNKKTKTASKYPISWSPDGKKLAYATKLKRSKGGSNYYDLYVYNLLSDKEEKLTQALRAHSPHWHPAGKKLVFVSGQDGTENISTLNLETRQVVPLTRYANNEQIVHPQWSPDGKTIAYSMFRKSGQDLYLLNVESLKSSPLLADEYDSRDPSFSPDGKKIYFSWDKTGIFNIYSLHLETGKFEQLTNVVGGAFMPSVNQRGELLFSTFTSDGYKIARLNQPAALAVSDGEYLASNGESRAFDSLPASLKKHVEEQQLYNDADTPQYEVTPYKTHPASLAFLPRVMIDYGTVKIGTYLYSYDVLDKYGFLAGFDINKRGDYDLFGLFEYRKLGPTIFLELYNQVQGTSVDVDSLDLIQRGLFNTNSATDKFKYNLIEANLGLSFKLGHSNELRTAFVLSRYSATAKFKEAVGDVKLNYRYFIGRDISVKFIHHGFAANIDSDINPSGRFLYLGYNREFNKFLRSFATDRVVGIEEFDNFNYNRFSLGFKEFRKLPIPGHHLSLGVQAGFIDTEVDSFFNYFGGGLGIPLDSYRSEPYQINAVSNRGYPFYSIEGRKLLQGRLTYRFPLLRNLDLRFLHLSFDKIFLGSFIEYGNAFNGKLDFDDFKTSVGGELRLDTSSFYAFPTRFSFIAAYGLNEFMNSGTRYGKEWRFYFGMTFGFFN